jgi:hypothetical protein
MPWCRGVGKIDLLRGKSKRLFGRSGFSCWGGAVVSNFYCTNNVTGEDGIGGLVRWNEDGTVGSSFWDTATSGQTLSDGGTGKTTTQMKAIATFSGGA